jgi:hypothetical protein
MHVYMYVCICIHVYMCVCMHACMYITHIHQHTYIMLHIHKYTGVYQRINLQTSLRKFVMHASPRQKKKVVCVRAHMCMYVCIGMLAVYMCSVL